MDDLINEFLDKSVIESLSNLMDSNNADEFNKSAAIVASGFGAGEYKISSADDYKKLIASFRNNLSLLVEKTWVEKHDISVKEEVLYKLEQYCAAVEKDSWAISYLTFRKILKDVCYLMFGSQSTTDDFMNYALRIDPEFGIFCWYINSLPEDNEWSEEKNKAVQSVAMFFLANY